MPEKTHVLLGVTGGIAAYKIPNLCSRLVKGGFQVETILTANAQKIVSPIPFESLSGNRCHTDTFDPMDTSKVEHIALARQADLLVIAPASANIIAKLRWGLADDLFVHHRSGLHLSQAAGARHEHQYVRKSRHPGESLRAAGSGAISSWSRCPAISPVAQWARERCPSRSDIYDRIEAILACKKDLQGLRILVTAGPTQEPLDPVRYLTNHSSGKMGYAIAHAAMLRGADVTLVSGPTALKYPASCAIRSPLSPPRICMRP